MNALAALALALVAGASPAGAPPPEPAPSAGPAPAAASPGAPAPEGAPSFAPPPPAAPAEPPVAPEWSMLGGVLETRLMGMSARGVRLRAGAGFPVAGRFSLLQLALDVFAGETRPGLPLRGGSLGLEAWMDPARRVRGGLGTVLGAVAYRRFTSPGEWPALLTVGVRAGVELDAWRLRAGTIVVGAHADASFGPWYSACVSAGFRRGGVRQAAW